MFQKPTSKTITSAAVKVGAGVVGAKVSDGAVAIMPDSAKDYAKPIVALAALAVAACMSPKSTGEEAVQAAFVGAALKQGTDYVTELLTDNVDAKDNSTTLNKFVNGLVGHPTIDAAPLRVATTERTASLNAYRKRKRSLHAPNVYEFEATREVPMQVAQVSMV